MLSKVHPLCRTCFGQYQALSSVLGWPGDGDAISCVKMKWGGWPYSCGAAGSNSSNVVSLYSCPWQLSLPIWLDVVSCLVHSLSHPPSLVCPVQDAPGSLPHLQLVSLPVQFLPNKTELLGTHKEGIIGDKVAHKPHQNKHLQGYRTVSFKNMQGGKRGGGGGGNFSHLHTGILFHCPHTYCLRVSQGQ